MKTISSTRHYSRRLYSALFFTLVLLSAIIGINPATALGSQLPQKGKTALAATTPDSRISDKPATSSAVASATATSVSSASDGPIKYSDPVYGIYMEVPSNWSISPATAERSGSLTRFLSVAQTVSDPRPADKAATTGITIEAGVQGYDKPANVGLAQWASVDQNLQANLVAQKLTTLAGREVLRQDFGSGDGATTVFLVPAGTKVYFLAIRPTAALEQPSVVKMLATFAIARQYTKQQPQANYLYPRANDRVKPGGSKPDQVMAPGGYRLPFVGYRVITTGPGCYYTHTGRSSEAIDISMPTGTEVYAAKDGEVAYASYFGDFGNLLQIQHGDGNRSWYAHLGSFVKRSGHVNYEEHVAYSASTGNSTGPHLHFEVRNGGDQSIWIRDLPGIHWFSNNANSPCQTFPKADGEATGPARGNQSSGELEVSGSLRLSTNNAQVGQEIVAEFTIKNNTNQSIFMRRIGAGGRGPNCGDWNCGNYADFPYDENVTIGRGEQRTYRRGRSFSATGGGYFAEPVWQDGSGNWHGLRNANRVGFSIAAAARLEVVRSLTISIGNPYRDQVIVAEFTVRNTGSQGINVRRLGAAGRGPNCGGDWNCPRGADFPFDENVTINPGDQRTFRRERSYQDTGNYFLEPVYQEQDGSWHGMSGANRVSFDVSRGLEVIQALALAPANPTLGQQAAASFKIKNFSGQNITLRSLGAAGRGPNCGGDWNCNRYADFPMDNNFTIPAGQERTYSKTRSYQDAGAGYFIETLYQDAAGRWLGMPGGGRINFAVSVGPRLEVVRPLTLSAASPYRDQMVVAEYTVRNSGSQGITVRRLGAAGRGPNCGGDWNCPRGADFPFDENVTINPGEQRTFRRERSYQDVGSGYFLEPIYQAQDGSWRGMDAGANRVNFEVTRGLEVVQPLTLSPTNPVRGQQITAQFIVKNFSSQQVSLRVLMASGRGPNCGDWNCGRYADFPVIANPTIAAGEQFTYRQAASFDAGGDGYFAQPMYQNAGGQWLAIPGGNRVSYSVGQSVLADALLPFEGRKRYTSGPHGYPDAGCAGRANSNEQAGLDFARDTTSAEENFEVLSIAAGWLVTSHNADDNIGLGRYVAIEHPGGIVSQYWHLSELSAQVLALGDHAAIPRGFPLGRAGKSGGQKSVHLHLELRTTDNRLVGWHGRAPIDGYQFWSFKRTDNSNYPDYQGTATRGSYKSVTLDSDKCGQVTAVVGQNFGGRSEDNANDPNTIFSEEGYSGAGYLQSHNHKDVQAQSRLQN